MAAATQTVSKGKPVTARKGAEATFSLSVLPKENQPAEGRAEKEAYISLTGLFKKVYDGVAEASYMGKNTVTDADTGAEETIIYGIFSMKDTPVTEGMVLKSKPFIQPGGKGTPNVSEEKWKQIAVLKGMVRDGKQKYFGSNDKGDLFFVNTRTPK
jgi:hypothetical protein